MKNRINGRIIIEGEVFMMKTLEEVCYSSKKGKRDLNSGDAHEIRVKIKSVIAVFSWAILDEIDYARKTSVKLIKLREKLKKKSR